MDRRVGDLKEWLSARRRPPIVGDLDRLLVVEKTAAGKSKLAGLAEELLVERFPDVEARVLSFSGGVLRIGIEDAAARYLIHQAIAAKELKMPRGVDSVRVMA